jgi:hypothetical protein
LVLLAVLIPFLRHENAAPFNVANSKAIFALKFTAESSMFGRLSWRPLSFQAKPAMSAVGVRPTRVIAMIAGAAAWPARTSASHARGFDVN